MPTKRIRRGRHAQGRLSEDQEAHLCDGWCLDACVPWYRRPGYPFRDPEHRREVWEENKVFLAAKYPGCDLAAAAEYDGKEVDAERFPGVWGRLAGSGPSSPLADVVHLAETEADDGNE